MAVAAEKIYVFEEFRLEPETRTLVRHADDGDGDEIRIRLSNRPFQVLLYLIENRDRIVARRELLEKFWDGREVYDEAVTKCVGAIRKALDEPPPKQSPPRFIETRWAGGYRFIGGVEERPRLPSYLEIEKSREVKIVIEESDSETPNADSGRRGERLSLPSNSRETDVSASRTQAANFRVSASPRLRFAALAAILILFLAVAGFVFFRNGSFRQSATAPPNSIAVLPLKNLSGGNSESEIFSDGLTESLISSLSKIEGLKVISRNSSFAFKNKDAEAREIGRQLGVKTFIEGSVRERGGQIRVEVRLVNAENGEILWSGEAYNRPLGDVFEIQDEIARNVATRLRLRLTQADEKRLTSRHTNNAEAYQAYVKGRYFWKKKDRANLEKAKGYFEEAIRLDPNYALAYAGLVDYYLTGIWYSDFSPAEAVKDAKAAVAKISEINDRLPEARAARARIAEAEWDWENYRNELEKALELNPNEASYWQGYAFFLRNVDGRFDEALTAIRRAQELDPLSVSVNTDVGVMLIHAGRFDEAIETFKKTLETDPRFHDAYWNLGLAYERKKMERQAVEAFTTSWRLKGDGKMRLAADAAAAAYAQDGMKGFWRKSLETSLAEAEGKNFMAFVIAAWYARVGEREAALEWLEKSYIAREPYLVNLKSEFAFDSLRSDARFQDLLRRVGLEK